MGDVCKSFRPLSRYIGLYQSDWIYAQLDMNEFPSPLEVYRFISYDKAFTNYKYDRFPSPLEVYRFISMKMQVTNYTLTRFPSPLEVYRFISLDLEQETARARTVSVPSRGI